jgi:nicotinamidase-related amidase
MIGLWTEICLTFFTVDALANGYQVTILTDAVGGTTLEAHQMAILRMIQVGAIPNTTFAFAAEMNPDWADPAADHLRKIGGWYMGQLAAINNSR